MDALSVEASASATSSDAEQFLDDLNAIFPLETATEDRSTERRRRHREGAARRRSEQRTRIQRLAAQASALHRRLRHALAWIQRHRAHHEANDCRCLAYVELVTAAEALLQEQYSLEDELYFRERYARLVQADGARLEEDSDRAAEDLLETTYERDGYWVRYTPDDVALFYEYESPENCAAAIQAGVDSVVSIRDALANGPCESTHCLAWQVEYSALDPTSAALRYRFKRRVPSIQTTVDDLDARTWTAMHTPSRLRKIYGPIAARVVQHVSDDTVILLCDATVRMEGRPARYFHLTSRLRPAETDSSAIVTVVLPKQPRQQELETRHCLTSSPPSVMWVQSGVSSFEFKATTDDAIVIEYCGSIECGGSDNVRHLVTETCLALLQWEQLVVPPRTLTS